MPSAAAVMVAAPGLAPRTRPDPSTVATDSSPDDQANSAPATVWPFSSKASALNRTVSLISTVSTDGDTVTDAAACITFTVAVPVA